MALLRQFLTEKEQDVYGNFGLTVASMLRKMRAPVSGKAMVEMLTYLNKASNFTEEEEEDFLNDDMRTDD